MDIGTQVRSVLRRHGIRSLDDLTHDQQERIAREVGLTTPRLHQVVGTRPPANPSSPHRRAAMLIDESDRLRDEAQRTVQGYHQAAARGDSETSLLLRHAALRKAKLADELVEQADRLSQQSIGANATCDPRTGEVSYSTTGGVRKARKQLKRARDGLVAQARRRAARGDRPGANESLTAAEAIERALDRAKTASQ